jgi:hypothetical protein
MRFLLWTRRAVNASVALVARWDAERRTPAVRQIERAWLRRIGRAA